MRHIVKAKIDGYSQEVGAFGQHLFAFFDAFEVEIIVGR